MPTLPPLFRPKHLGPRRRAEARRQQEQAQRRGTAAERLYDARWQRASAAWRKQPENVLCVCCKANGVVKVAELVDHIIPHKGDLGRFWDQGNWQSLCDRCHQTIKRLLEQAFSRGEVSAEELKLNRLFPEHFG